MRTRCLSNLCNHAHVLLIMPLVIIVMTWPTFARMLDSQDLWFHTVHGDFWLRIWDAWHLERVLTGRADLFFTNEMFHPTGVSLAWQHSAYPHAALLMALRKLMPVDSAYNLLFLLILYFNACCAYVLALKLIKDKWIALFGATVACVSVPFLSLSTLPDLIMIGTIPLTLYFLYRGVEESRWRFAALAGACAGVTAFISIYIFFINLMTVGIVVIFLAISHWKMPSFWRGLLLFTIICASICAFRFYPMVVDATALKEGLETHLGRVRSNDVLECCVVISNPFTGDLFRRALAIPPDSETNSLHLVFKDAYLGYINIFFLLCAILHKPLRRRLAPWLAVLVVFSILRLGHFLTINGHEYRNILLPEYFLSDWFPALFGSFYIQEYYQFGVVVPLAMLASFGLARLIRSKPVFVRASVITISTLILVMEFNVPLLEKIFEREKIAYFDWLSTEPDDAIKLINLPQGTRKAQYYMGLQTLNDYPTAFGRINRNPVRSRSYIRSNALLNSWDNERSVHCLPHNERRFRTALNSLLEDGFSHVVVHNWLYGDQFINHSFRYVPASYDDKFVSVYRLRDLRMSCDPRHIELAPFRHFAESPSVYSGRRSSILSLHPSESIDEDRFAYLTSLFSNWRSLVHLHLDDDEPVIQSAGESFPDLESFARDNQLIYLIYNRHDMESAALRSHISFAQFNLCKREEHEDGSVVEHYLSRDFACALLNSRPSLQVDYANGARLENTLLDITQDQLALQVIWSGLPSEPHSVSLQVFDAAGAKILGQDSTIGHDSLGRYLIDVSDLEPGDYAVKLIVYNFESKRSVSGTVSRTGERFERDFLITTFTRA